MLPSGTIEPNVGVVEGPDPSFTMVQASKVSLAKTLHCNKVLSWFCPGE
jgi:hypothetical protein